MCTTIIFGIIALLGIVGACLGNVGQLLFTTLPCIVFSILTYKEHRKDIKSINHLNR